MIAPPASVVGTNQLACMRIENARAWLSSTSRRPSDSTRDQLVRPDVTGRRRDRDAERERRRDEDGLERVEVDADGARDEVHRN